MQTSAMWDTVRLDIIYYIYDWRFCLETLGRRDAENRVI